MSYSASCPVCGYEHDYSTKAEMDKAWKRWQRAVVAIFREASK